MKRKNLGCLFAFFFTLVLFTTAHARMILWQIGVLNYSYLEDRFVSTNKDIIDYQVPSNWKDIQGQEDPNWGDFPAALYTVDDSENNPREIRINFCYLEEYNNPELIFISRPESESVDPNNTHLFLLYKGNEILIGKRSITSIQYNPYIFPLGYIKKELHKENRITIKVSGPSDMPIIFDTVYLSLYEKDSDGDGIIDTDEGDCYLDRDTVCIPIRSYNPSDIKRISLYIEKSGGTPPSLYDVRFLDQNDLRFPDWIRPGYFFPYGFLGFRVGEVVSQDNISIQIGYMHTLYPSARFFVYQDSNEWQEVDFEFLDGNIAKIFLNDGGTGDFDREKDGNINTIIGLSYNRELDTNMEKGSCFIKAFSQ